MSSLESAHGFIRDELLQRGAALFQPLASAADVDLAVRVGPASGESSRQFQVERLRPHPSLFIVCVAFDGDTPSGVWVFPSATFGRFADGPSRGASRDLDLDARAGRPDGAPSPAGPGVGQRFLTGLAAPLLPKDKSTYEPFPLRITLRPRAAAHARRREQPRALLRRRGRNTTIHRQRQRRAYP